MPSRSAVTPAPADGLPARRRRVGHPDLAAGLARCDAHRRRRRADVALPVLVARHAGGSGQRLDPHRRLVDRAALTVAVEVAVPDRAVVLEADRRLPRVDADGHTPVQLVAATMVSMTAATSSTHHSGDP